MVTTPSTLRVRYVDGSVITELDPIVKSVTWSGELSAATRKLDVTLHNTTNNRTPAISIKLGKSIQFYHNDKRLFTGVIFNKSTNSSGEVTLTCYDANVYLTKNAATRSFKNKKASDLIRSLCVEFGIPYGNITDTGYVIPKLIFRAKSLWDMMVIAITETSKVTNKRYYIGNVNGKLELRLRTEQVTQFVLENGRNVLSSSYSVGIDDMKTQVEVVGGEEGKEIRVIKKDTTLQKAYGIMQHAEEKTDLKTRAQLEQFASSLLREHAKVTDEATLEAIGIDTVFSGTSVYALDTMTGIKGSYYVIADSHSFSSGTHTMSLTLSYTDELPKMDYEAPSETTSSKSSNKPYLKNLPSIATSGIKRTYASDKAYELAMKHKLKITSGYRAPSHEASQGNKKSDHIKGKAYDFSGTTANMDAYCKALLASGIKYKQIIWRNKDQLTGTVITGHMDHVHVAFS